ANRAPRPARLASGRYPRPMRRPLAAVAALAAALAGCSLVDLVPAKPMPGPVTSEAPEPTRGPVAPEDSPVYQQKVTWRECDGFECASIEVPLDWSDPAGPTVLIAVNRSAARKPDERIGSLLINPGGPGGSGLDLLEGFVDTAGAELLDHFDVIGFDPRGVGKSTPVSCGSSRELDEFFVTDFFVEAQD